MILTKSASSWFELTKFTVQQGFTHLFDTRFEKNTELVSLQDTEAALMFVVCRIHPIFQ